MAVGIRVGQIVDEIGAPSFVHAFFSTICVHCDAGQWGSRFPVLMKQLYDGRVSSERANVALEELREARQLLSRIEPSKVVWDIEDRTARPPWGDHISDSITSLGNYFVSSTGRDVFELLEGALAAAVAGREDALLQ